MCRAGETRTEANFGSVIQFRFRGIVVLCNRALGARQGEFARVVLRRGDFSAPGTHACKSEVAHLTASPENIQFGH